MDLYASNKKMVVGKYSNVPCHLDAVKLKYGSLITVSVPFSVSLHNPTHCLNNTSYTDWCYWPPCQLVLKHIASGNIWSFFLNLTCLRYILFLMHLTASCSQSAKTLTSTFSFFDDLSLCNCLQAQFFILIPIYVILFFVRWAFS
jgi:hypothetical protein